MEAHNKPVTCSTHLELCLQKHIQFSNLLHLPRSNYRVVLRISFTHPGFLKKPPPLGNFVIFHISTKAIYLQLSELCKLIQTNKFTGQRKVLALRCPNTSESRRLIVLRPYGRSHGRVQALAGAKGLASVGGRWGGCPSVSAGVWPGDTHTCRTGFRGAAGCMCIERASVMPTPAVSLQRGSHLHPGSVLSSKMNVHLLRRGETGAAGTGGGERRPPPTRDPREITLLGQVSYATWCRLLRKPDRAFQGCKCMSWVENEPHVRFYTPGLDREITVLKIVLFIHCLRILRMRI